MDIIVGFPIKPAADMVHEAFVELVVLPAQVPKFAVHEPIVSHRGACVNG